MKTTLSTMLISFSLLCSPSFAATGDAEAGKARAAVCAACHGVNGVASIPSYPNLAGQNAQYIVSSLKAYKNGQRNGGMAGLMQPQAAMLSDKDMENIAAYYSSLKP